MFCLIKIYCKGRSQCLTNVVNKKIYVGIALTTLEPYWDSDQLLAEKVLQSMGMSSGRIERQWVVNRAKQCEGVAQNYEEVFYVLHPLCVAMEEMKKP